MQNNGIIVTFNTQVHKSRATVAPVMFSYSLWNVLRVTLLAPRILKWLLDCWKVCAPLAYNFKAQSVVQ